ncbi:MAG: CHASE domain-containing protein [Methylobacter sp.]|uniref:histidine kinase n=1 Tax=Candidatus Methylobacter titanis TaxID=3053457 RepID=A0AA43TMA6_9GAMM|nr:CHASE domain-containing protein [Candidatus Methylobacter titanis]MDI1291535.1 CHASE domain-containing protein [Candidatus Methylobacter titanis]
MKLLTSPGFRLALPWLILLTGLLGTGVASYSVKSGIEWNEYRRFAFYCDEIRLKIAARLDAHKQILLSGAAMFDASAQVTRQEWSVFVRRLSGDEHFNGIQGLGFSVWVPPEQLAVHQAQIRAEGFPAYRLSPQGKRDAYTSIIYLEPFNQRNLRAFGYDMYSEAVRRAAMQQARDQNNVSLSGKVMLVQESDNDLQAGTLMYVPVYQKNQPVDTVEQRRNALFGWVYSPFRMGDLLNKVMSNFDDEAMMHVHLRVYDGVVQPENLLYSSAEPAHAESVQPLWQIDMASDFNGTLWTLQFEQITGTRSGIDYSKMWITLGAGLSSTFLLFLLLRSNLNMRVNAASMADRLTKQLRESEQRFRLLADSAPVLIWLSDTDKQCYYFNKIWLAFTGRTLEQSLGDRWAGDLHPDDYQYCLDTYSAAFDRRESFLMEYRLRRHDGVYRWLLDTGIPRFADDRTFLGYIGSCIDITEWKQMSAKLNRAHAELRQFTHIAAHHLQEPTRRLVSFVQRLRSFLPLDELNEEALMSLYFIEQSATRQSALVSDIQVYLAADQPRSPVREISMVDVVADLLEQRAALISDIGAQIYFEGIHPVYIDRPRLKDIFSILLDNALQYRHAEHPLQIRISSELKAERAVYRFADNGIGIPEEYRERVFGVFERLQVQSDQNSTGIGLAIVRRIVESCDGSVILQETPGGGVTAVFDLPG